jgi:hypothetical protein
MLKTLLPLLIFLTLEACSSVPADTKFSGKWQVCEPAPQKYLMCLEDQDLLKLKSILDRCGAAQ